MHHVHCSINLIKCLTLSCVAQNLTHPYDNETVTITISIHDKLYFLRDDLMQGQSSS